MNAPALRSRDPGDTEEQAARAALFILRASLEANTTLSRYTLRSAGVVGDADAAIQELMEAPKPLEYTGRVVGSIIEITIFAQESSGFQPHDLREGPTVRYALERSGGPNGRKRNISLSDGDEELILSARELMHWVENYHPKFPFEISADEATIEQRARGITCQMTVGPGATLTTSPGEITVGGPIGDFVREEFIRLSELQSPSEGREQYWRREREEDDSGS